MWRYVHVSAGAHRNKEKVSIVGSVNGTFVVSKGSTHFKPLR